MSKLTHILCAATVIVVGTLAWNNDTSDVAVAKADNTYVLKQEPKPVGVKAPAPRIKDNVHKCYEDLTKQYESIDFKIRDAIVDEWELEFANEGNVFSKVDGFIFKLVMWQVPAGGYYLQYQHNTLDKNGLCKARFRAVPRIVVNEIFRKVREEGANLRAHQKGRPTV